MTLRDYLKVFRHYGLLILATVLAAAALTWFLTPAEAAGPAVSYTARATLLVTTTESPSGGSGVGLGRVALYMTTGEVPVRVAKKLGFTDDPALLARQVSVAPDPISMSLTVASSDTDPERAAALANTVADESVAFFSERRSETAGTRLSILERATPIADEAKATLIPPGRLVRTPLAAGLGLLLGMGLALLLKRIDSRIRSREEIQAAIGLPIIAEVPKVSGANREHVGTVVATDPLSVFADGYRAARTAISHTLARAAPQDAPPIGGRRARRVDEAPWVLVTSASPAEGKTTSIGNLAASFAESGKRVLVLDADLRSPDVHQVFDVPQGAGISDYLTDPDHGPLSTLIRPTSVPGVTIITAGTQLDHPASLASRMGLVQNETRHLADIVLVDSAPLLAASDVFDLLPLVDTVLLVVRAGKITEPAASRVAELLSRFRVPVSGVLLIGAARKRGRGYGYGYGYGESRVGQTRSRRGGRSVNLTAKPSLPPKVDGDQDLAGERSRTAMAGDGEHLAQAETRSMRRTTRSSG